MLIIDDTNPMNKRDRWMLINTDRPIKMSELKDELLKHVKKFPKQVRELTDQEQTDLIVSKLRGES